MSGCQDSMQAHLGAGAEGRAESQTALEDPYGWVNRLGATDRLCETLSSWRLLVGGLSPGASHHSFTTSSEEPPLSNFNSYRDISFQLANVWLTSLRSPGT